MYGTYLGGEGATAEEPGVVSRADGVGESSGCVVIESPEVDVDEDKSKVLCRRPESSLSCSILPRQTSRYICEGAREAKRAEFHYPRLQIRSDNSGRTNVVPRSSQRCDCCLVSTEHHVIRRILPFRDLVPPPPPFRDLAPPPYHTNMQRAMATNDVLAQRKEAWRTQGKSRAQAIAQGHLPPVRRAAAASKPSTAVRKSIDNVAVTAERQPRSSNDADFAQKSHDPDLYLNDLVAAAAFAEYGSPMPECVLPSSLGRDYASSSRLTGLVYIISKSPGDRGLPACSDSEDEGCFRSPDGPRA